MVAVLTSRSGAAGHQAASSHHIGILSNALALGYRPTRGVTNPDDVVVGADPAGVAVAQAPLIQ